MRIPNQIEIGGHVIKIEMRSGLVSYNQAYGMFDPTELKILIDADIKHSIQIETFWHEVVEALNFFCEANMDHSKIQTFGFLLHQVSISMDKDSQNEITDKKKRG